MLNDLFMLVVTKTMKPYREMFQKRRGGLPLSNVIVTYFNYRFITKEDPMIYSILQS